MNSRFSHPIQVYLEVSMAKREEGDSHSPHSGVSLDQRDRSAMPKLLEQTASL